MGWRLSAGVQCFLYWWEVLWDACVRSQTSEGRACLLYNLNVVFFARALWPVGVISHLVPEHLTVKRISKNMDLWFLLHCIRRWHMAASCRHSWLRRWSLTQKGQHFLLPVHICGSLSSLSQRFWPCSSIDLIVSYLLSHYCNYRVTQKKWNIRALHYMHICFTFCAQLCIRMAVVFVSRCLFM